MFLKGGDPGKNPPTNVFSRPFIVQLTRLLLGGGDGLLGLAGDAVEIPAALGSEDAASIGVLGHQLQLLQGLENLAGDGAGSAGPVAGGGAVVPSDCKQKA